MAKTDTVYMRIEPRLKANSEAVLSVLGLTHNEAINIFLNQVVLQKGLPFEVKIPHMTKAEAQDVLYSKINEAEASFKDEPRISIEQLKDKWGA